MKSPSLVREAAIDASILLGAGLLTYGAWLIYAPAGFIVPGVLLLAGGLFGVTR